MYEEQTASQITEELLKGTTIDYDKTPGHLPYELASTTAVQIEKVYQAITQIQKMVDVDNLKGVDLERFVFQRKGVARKLSRKSVGPVILEGSGQIAEGAIFETETGIRFIVEESKTFGTGTFLEVKARAAEGGAAGNLPAGTITQMPITIPGIISVTNPQPMTGGFPEESDDDLRQRYYEVLQKPPTSGNKHHYKAWAKEVAGVGDAFVISLWDGDNTVKVVIIDSNREPASAELVSEVQQYMDPLINGKPGGRGEGAANMGAYCTVVSATGKGLTLKLQVVKQAGYSDVEIKNNIVLAARAYIRSMAFKQNYISISVIGSLILGCSGVLDYSNLTINDQGGNVSLLETEVATLTDVNLIGGTG